MAACPQTRFLPRVVQVSLPEYFRVMRSLFRVSVLARSFVPVLAIVAMVARGLVPVGWMPADDMRAPLVLCPMGNMHPAPARHGAPQQSSACPFTASLAQLA